MSKSFLACSKGTGDVYAPSSLDEVIVSGPDFEEEDMCAGTKAYYGCKKQAKSVFVTCKDDKTWSAKEEASSSVLPGALPRAFQFVRIYGSLRWQLWNCTDDG